MHFGKNLFVVIIQKAEIIGTWNFYRMVKLAIFKHDESFKLFRLFLIIGRHLKMSEVFWKIPFRNMLI